MPKKVSKSEDAPNRTARATVITKDNGGLSFDVAEAIAHIGKADPVMKDVMRLVGEFRLQPVHMQTPFEALGESIIYQQLHGKAAATILRRVKELYRPQGAFTPEDILNSTEEQLRGAGLSRNKTLALQDLASKAHDGFLPTQKQLIKMTDDEIVDKLVTIRGIGRWTVQMMLIFKLGKPDVLPIDDYGVRKGFAVTHGLADLPKPKELESFGEIWSPYRTVASWYLWRVLDLPPDVASSCAPKNARTLTSTSKAKVVIKAKPTVKAKVVVKAKPTAKAKTKRISR